jgi:hypothetical protein
MNQGGISVDSKLLRSLDELRRQIEEYESAHDLSASQRASLDQAVKGIDTASAQLEQCGAEVEPADRQPQLLRDLSEVTLTLRASPNPRTAYDAVCLAIGTLHTIVPQIEPIEPWPIE